MQHTDVCIPKIEYSCEQIFFLKKKTGSWKKLISPHQREVISVETSMIYGRTRVWALKFEIDPDSKTVSSLGGFIIFARYICKSGKCDEPRMQVRLTPFWFCTDVVDAALRLRPQQRLSRRIREVGGNGSQQRALTQEVELESEMMCLKPYQMPAEHHKLDSNTPRQDFTRLENYHIGKLCYLSAPRSWELRGTRNQTGMSTGMMLLHLNGWCFLCDSFNLKHKKSTNVAGKVVHLLHLDI